MTAVPTEPLPDPGPLDRQLAETLPAVDPSAASFTSERLGPYPVTGHLGAGGMGEVLAVEDRALDRTMAAKVIRGAADARAERLFLREARITGSLEHPNIVPVHVVGRDGSGALFFTMKEVRGRTLEELLHTLGPARAARLPYLLTVFAKVADAVRFAHARGIVHRDLKPANIMVGEFGEVYVCDWGLARELARADEPDPARVTPPDAEPGAPIGARTSDGAVVGTPAYMPPEQAEGRTGLLDRRSDVYALGAVLYQILTGVPPFAGGTGWDILLRVIDGDFVPPRRRDPAVPGELEAVVLRAMARSPQDRYPDVEALAGDIEAFLAGRTLAAARYSPIARVRKWAARHRGLVGGACAVLAVACTLTATAFAARWRERAAVRASALDQAARAHALVAALAPALRGAAPDRVRPAAPVTGPEEPARADTVRAARERALDACWGATAALDRALLASPDDDALLDARRAAGTLLGQVACAAGDYTLARAAFAALDGYGASAEAVAAGLAMVDKARDQLLEAHRARLVEITSDIVQGLGRPGRARGAPLLDDYVFEAVRYQEPETVALLGAILDRLALVARGADGRIPEVERPLAVFACRVLGRIDLAGAVDPLGRLLAATTDPYLACEAGLALCNTRDARARPVLDGARERLGSDSEAWRRIRRAYARVPAAATLSAPPTTALAWCAQAHALRDRGDLPGAIAALDQAVALAPQDPGVRCLRAAARYDARDFAAAAQDTDVALAGGREHTPAYVIRGRCRLRMGQRALAMEDGLRARELDPGLAEARMLLGSIHLAARQPALAVRELTRALEIDPDQPACLSSRASARLDLRDYDGALADVSRALELDPDSAECLTQLGRIRAWRGELARAREALDRAVELDPGSPAAVTQRGVVRRDQGDLAGAIADHTAAIALDPHCASAYSHRGCAWAAQGDHAAALADHDRACELDPDHPVSYSNRGNTLAAMGEHARALADYDRALALDPGFANSWYNRGNTRRALGDVGGAIADFRRAIELDPDRAPAHVNLGAALEDSGDRAGAIAAYRRAIELEPRLWNAHLNLGLALERAGEIEAARAAFLEARRLAPAAKRARIDLDLARLPARR